MTKKLTTKEFIKKAIEKHGNRYDYSRIRYKNSRSIVMIICKIHGSFDQTPHNHLCGKGCKKCGRIMAANKKRKTNNQFIIEAKKEHGDRYDYSKTKYTGSSEKIVIICNKHGEFVKNPFNHLKGQGCKQCKKEEIIKNMTKTTKDFIKNALKTHGHKYGYSKVDYIHARIKVIITCIKHGDFSQTPNSHLRGNGCNKCAVEEFSDKCRSNVEEFIKKAN